MRPSMTAIALSCAALLSISITAAAQAAEPTRQATVKPQQAAPAGPQAATQFGKLRSMLEKLGMTPTDNAPRAVCIAPTLAHAAV